MSKQPRAAILDHSPIEPDGYVILTSKPGQFRTELGQQMRAMECYDYQFCGRTKANFVIATYIPDAKVRIFDDSDPSLVNQVPIRLLERFETLENARRELQQLAKFGSMDIALVKL
jgi:hypothetical protein